MAGRGRGRGRGSMSFSVESLGFGRGEALPTCIYTPPPSFPPLEFQPQPLSTSEEYQYLLALKQEYRGSMRESPYNIKPPDKRKDIARYSDKYQLGQQDNSNWQPDWSRLPAELKIKVRKKTKVKAIIQPKLPVLPRNTLPIIKDEDLAATLAELEKQEQVVDVEEKEEEEKEGGEEEAAEEEEYYDDEDDLEEETDYNLTYFDNGENYGADEDDDLDEGPIY